MSVDEPDDEIIRKKEFKRSFELNIEAIRSHGRVWKYKGEAFVENVKMADAIWSATIVDKK